MANLIVSAVSTFDNKGLRKGKKEITAFEQTINKLGKTFASVFAAQKLLAFSKKAVNAFMEDEKAAKSLEVQLRNTGFAFSSPAVEDYIANLQKTTGVLDDQLRPAFQQLLTVTGSITKSQEALSTALNVSAATGKSLTEVSAALTRAYSGNTTGLSRLGAGISKATLKAGDMDKILGELNKKFTGQSQARLTTYAGKMDLLTVAAEDARETIGKGLLDAISLIGKDTGITTATQSMNNFAQSTADAIVGVGVLIAKLKEMGNTKVGNVLFDVKNIPVLGAYLAGFAEIGAAQRAGTAPDNKQGRASARIFGQQLRLENKLSEQKKKELALLDAKNKKQTEVDKLSEKFDTERIGLMKALNEATDAETKLRIQAKIAILDNNEALAKKYNAELLAKSATDSLANAANNAANTLNTLPNKFDEIFRNVYQQSLALGNDVAGARAMAGMSSRLAAEAQGFLEGTGRYGQPLNPIYAPSTPTATTTPGVVVQKVEVNTGAVLTNQQDLSIYIQNALGEISKLGNGSIIPAGSIAFQ
jgi:hypothetical protein